MHKYQPVTRNLTSAIAQYQQTVYIAQSFSRLYFALVMVLDISQFLWFISPYSTGFLYWPWNNTAYEVESNRYNQRWPPHETNQSNFAFNAPKFVINTDLYEKYRAVSFKRRLNEWSGPISKGNCNIMNKINNIWIASFKIPWYL